MNSREPQSLRVAFATLGCKVNQAESEALVREFASVGYELADFDDCADVYILNSCTVTHIADRKSRQLVRQARRRNPDALVAVTGCYAEVDGKDVARSIGADLVVGNADKCHLLAFIWERLEERSRKSGQSLPVVACPPSDHHHGLPSRTRTMVKIQDGCNNFCSYCIVPLARGRERSVPVEDVIGEVRSRVDAGYKEIVLTGVHAGAYGKGLPGRPTLAGLIDRILAETAVQRLRLSSIEPWDLDPALLEFLSDPRFCRHLHLPLQSGSDSALRRMRRRYTSAEFAALVDKVRAVDSEVAITTDVIVGFPGETDEEFVASYQFCRDLGFARMHVFRYSPRRGTRAAEEADQVDEPTKKARSEAMMALAEENAVLFKRRFVGQHLVVLWEHAKGAGVGGWRPGEPIPATQPLPPTDVWTGLTDNYIRVDAICREEIGNRLVPARISAETGDGLWGEVGQSTVGAASR